MTTTHTPGSWALNLPATTEIVADIGGADISIAQHVRNRADARLIAAAPDLLAALQALVDEYKPNLKAFALNAPRKAKWESAVAAIARATKGD